MTDAKNSLLLKAGGICCRAPLAPLPQPLNEPRKWLKLLAFGNPGDRCEDLSTAEGWRDLLQCSSGTSAVASK